jgi:hypothetical protein
MCGGGKIASLAHTSPKGISVSNFIDTIHEEWGVISGAPWSFVTAIVAVGAAQWIFMELIHRKEIAGKMPQ